MNANVVLLEPQAEAAPCAEELTRINESLRARERLLTASARARLPTTSARTRPRSKAAQEIPGPIT